MHRLDNGLKELIETGIQQGYLTYSQVNDYLPDEAVNPERLDNLLMSMEELGMDVVLDKTPPVKVDKKRGRRRGSRDISEIGRAHV